MDNAPSSTGRPGARLTRGRRAQAEGMRTPTPWPLPQHPTHLRELLRPGITADMVASQVRAGALLRLRAGVYLAASVWPDDRAAQQLLLARAEQQALPAAVISHNSAALAWDLPGPVGAAWHGQPPTVTLARASGYRSRTPGAARIVAGRLPAHRVVRHPDGYQVTDVFRTAVDVSAGLERPALLAILDAAARQAATAMVASPLRAHYANPTVIDAVRRELLLASEDRRRVGEVRLLTPLVDPRRESPIESLTAAHLAEAGLPMPEFQAPIRTRWGILYPDCLWRSRRLVGEADGAEKYRDPQASLREKEREQVLRDLDYRVVRWLGREIVFHPEVVMDRIARALADG